MDLEYDRIYKLNKKVTIYQSPLFIEMISAVLDSKPRHLKCTKHNSAIPFLIKETKFGSVLNSLPFFGSCGGLVGDGGICIELKDQLQEIINDPNSVSINIISNWLNEYKFSEIYQNFNVIERINSVKYLAHLGSSQNDLMNSYHSKTRNIVRGSLKANFQFCDVTKDIEILKEMHFNIMESKSRKSKPIKFWDELQNIFVPGVNYIAYGAKFQNELIAYVLFLIDENLKQVEYFIPCANDLGRNKNANYFVLHNSIAEFRRLGFTRIHFGGSHLNQLNLIRFKERWGSKNERYVYYNYFSSLMKDVSANELNEEIPFFYVKPFEI